jgi:23S rRNA (cytidine1920-2'-O)/16S rRNA (cytidine1409-2'-O)-methyltransferase
MPKCRLDQLLLDQGLCESREKAQRLIRSGRVRVDEQLVDKPGRPVPPDSVVRVIEPECFVSRGGQKLEAALERFPIEVQGRTALDVGASTGGFTDCLLQRGAKTVFAVDVGRGQLHWRLRNDPRVMVMERRNARFLEPADLPETPGLAVIDVSFISLTRILPAVREVVLHGADIVTLIKPQFEAGKEQVGKGGVVRDPEVHRWVVDGIRDFGTKKLDLVWRECFPSPLKGPAGNIEFLAWWNTP